VLQAFTPFADKGFAAAAILAGSIGRGLLRANVLPKSCIAIHYRSRLLRSSPAQSAILIIEELILRSATCPIKAQRLS